MSDDGKAGRALRRIAKVVNYAKEQDFSDDDVFEDDAEKEEEPLAAAAAAPKRRGRPRKLSVEPEEDVDEPDYGPAKPIYTEKGYDPTLPPIRERFAFMPEYEPDGSPRIELIVGRRPVDDKNAVSGESDNDASDEESSEEDESEDGHAGRGRRKQSKRKEQPDKSPTKKEKVKTEHVEYEYLVKYKGRSYLHLDWKTGADLESMNKSAKTLYRRFLKKLAAGMEEDLEDPNFDPSYAEAQKIVDESEQEVTVELTDQELVEWEKERERALAEDDVDADDVAIEGIEDEQEGGASKGDDENGENGEGEHVSDDDFDEDIDFSTLSMDKIRKVVNKDGSYYPRFDGCDNPYRDGYVTEPPKKPRASYLFFQCAMRSYFQRQNPDASQGELMTILGDTWRNMSEQEQAPFIHFAREEAEQYDNERAMMEKAQKPNEMWQPLRRCKMVLDRLAGDGFANIFLEPVDTVEFADYEELVDQPMDLGTVQKKLAQKKYQAPENFARDVRKIWNNCKIYNRHGSAIWYVADYMSKQFERLYHAWVLEFRERYLRWVNPKARPWEHTCRNCDGKCGTPDDKMVLCDHCDAMYGMECLSPPLKKLPEGIWHCPDCAPKLLTVKGVRMYSAVSEQAARKRAELGDVPKKVVKQTRYLVKWAGLGYEFCTWETKEDINDDALIEEFRRLNNMTVDEPDLAEEEVNAFMASVEHVSMSNAGGSSCIPDLRAQLYAQTRAFQFTKFGTDLPPKLCCECGPKSRASAVFMPERNESESSDDDKPVTSQHVKEVVECVADMVFRVSRQSSQPLMNINMSLPPLLTGEYDAIIPITSKGLMMNVGEIHGSVAFLGYRSFPDGSKGPAELNNLIRNVGDKIVAVDGISTISKTFKEVILLLRESGKNKFAFMRFLENKYAVCSSDLTSVGNTGRYAVEELNKKFSGDRQRLLVQRRHQLLQEMDERVVKEEESDGSVGPDNISDDESDEGSEGEFEPDSEDEEIVRRKSILQGSGVPSIQGSNEVGASGIVMPVVPHQDVNANPNAQASSTGIPASSLEATQSAPVTKDENQAVVSVPPVTKDEAVTSASNMTKGKVEIPIVVRQETTRSLAYRLLDMDVGYSSDEGGEEGCAYFLDGVDSTFTRLQEVQTVFPKIDSHVPVKKGRLRKNVKKSEPTKDNDDDKGVMVPAKRNEFSNLGNRAKLSAAVALTYQDPDLEEFENFPLPSRKAMEAKAKVEAEAKAKGQNSHPDGADHPIDSSPSKTAKRSTVKVEQVSTSTGEVIRIWANAESAAATLQLPLNEIKRMLKGEYDEDLGDEIGGYLWRYAASGAEVTAAPESTTRGSKKGKEAFLEFRDKLYDPAEPHSYKNGNRLRDYQVDGVNWLASTWYKRYSCILADEMGLGKTVQIVSYIEHLYRIEKMYRPYLVVVPLSTVEHWRREFQGWTDMVCCVYHDRQRVWRDVMREYEWYFEDRPHTPDYLKFDVLVTTYDTLIGDFDIIGQIPWRVAVVDEAHRLRNVKGKLLECMKEISARGTLQYGFQSRVLMTGTPLQNNTQELWTLLNFIEPFKFPSLEEFQANFGNMANREQVEALQRKISPYMLRRVKEDVAKDIPSKEETLIDVELTSIQKQYYRAIFEHNHSFLSMGATRANAPKLMNIQMELRKCCNHPFLLDNVEQRETEKQYNEFVESGAFEGKTAEERQLMLNVHGYIQTSGKMVLLDKLLPKLRQEGHKVLIFSQMVRMLDLISEYCDFRGFRHERLDGRVRGNERQKAIDRFETEKDSFVFLLSTRAGGVGINLTAADICIIFDSDWNPQNDVQAQARCHRIGQTKDVMIYRLVTSRTFEQEMFDRASKKLGLEQAILGTFGQENDDDKPTSKEMEQLLKKGAYALLEDENDEMGRTFVSDDIESILAKRTRTRVVEGAKTASWLNKQGMVVSKSKFTGDSAAATANVDVDDPLFWQKVMPDFVTPTIMVAKLNDLSALVETGTSGRGRNKKKQINTDKGEDADAGESNHTGVESSDKANGTVDELPLDESNDEYEGKIDFSQLSRTNKGKVNKFMSDLKSMMDGIFEQAEDSSLPPNEKASCQKLLLTISIKERLFNEDQRLIARNMLKRLEGDRRRRCRTSTDQPVRFALGNPSRDIGDENGAVREELLILSKHQRRKRRKRDKPTDDQPDHKRKKKSSDDDENIREYIGDDGYLHHSDSEADWSDVGDDIYQGGRKRNGISLKEARRRRAWATEDDAATAAGRPWPAFPRHLVTKVLTTVLDEVIKYDKAKSGIFSKPVPRDEIPEYYELIKNPMDYGTMKEKLERGEYRSAQAMQKDFILVMQNCLHFNEKGSDIVKEARQQALMRPKILRDAAMKHKLFIAEDGSVLEVYTEGEGDKDEDGEGTPKKKIKRKNKKAGEDENGDDTKKISMKIPRKAISKGVKTRKTNAKAPTDEVKKDDSTVTDDDGSFKEDETDSVAVSSLKKPRIRISLAKIPRVEAESQNAAKKGKKRKPTKSTTKTEPDVDGISGDEGNKGDDEKTPGPKRKRRKIEKSIESAPLDELDNEHLTVSKKRRTKKIPDLADEKVDGSSEDQQLSNLSYRDSAEPGLTSKSDVTLENTAENGVSALETNEIPVDDPAAVYLDVAFWKKERESVDGNFKAARAYFTKRGPWQLPIGLIEKFSEVATLTLNKMCRHDHYSVFAEAVTEDDAPGYYEIIKKPMDFGTMRTRIKEGAYGKGQSAVKRLYNDFRLVFDNCARYNEEDGEVGSEAARLFALLPETYALACVALTSKRKKPKGRNSS